MFTFLRRIRHLSHFSLPARPYELLCFLGTGLPAHAFSDSEKLGKLGKRGADRYPMYSEYGGGTKSDLTGVSINHKITFEALEQDELTLSPSLKRKVRCNIASYIGCKRTQEVGCAMLSRACCAHSLRCFIVITATYE